MNVLFGTKLTPNLSRKSKNQDFSLSLMMHHVRNDAAFSSSSSSDAFDWRRSGVIVSTEWFKPTKRSDIVGNVRAIDELERWVQCWRRANSAKRKEDFIDRLPEYCCAFLRGPPGTSKLTTVKLLLAQNGYTDIVHIDASTMKSKQLLNDRLLPLLLNATPNRAIVVDELDGVHFSGGVNASNSDPLLVFMSPDTHKVAHGEKKIVRSIARGGLASTLSYYDQIAETRLAKGLSGCVTPCPIVFIASDHQYQFVFKSLERVCGTHANTKGSSFFLFRPIRTEDIEKRYAQLASRYNFFTRGKNVTEGKADWLVLHDLATAAGGDIRRAIALLTATIRRAYVDKQIRQARGKDDDCADSRLILRQRHCEALLKNQLTVQTSPFQACSFLLHDCPSVRIALDHIARFRMNNVPDMLFGGFHKITPVAKSVSTFDIKALAKTNQTPRDIESRNELASLLRLADTADAFSRADSYRQRSDYAYPDSSQMQQLYHDSVTTWSLLLLNHDQGATGYVFRKQGDTAAVTASTVGQMGLLQKRQFCSNFANCRKKDCNCRWMQKASLEAQRGQRSQWDRMSIEERNQYDQRTGQTLQTSSDRFLYFRNYVNSVQQVRAKGQQLATIKETALVDLYAKKDSKKEETLFSTEPKEPLVKKPKKTLEKVEEPIVVKMPEKKERKPATKRTAPKKSKLAEMPLRDEFGSSTTKRKHNEDEEEEEEQEAQEEEEEAQEEEEEEEEKMDHRKKQSLMTDFLSAKKK